MSPKSVLRLPAATSTLAELETGSFQKIIPDNTVPTSGVKRILLCTGKVYYDLAARREAEGRDDLAIVRLEQLYPFPDKELADALAPYADDVPVVWVQEEPRNMGSWWYLRALHGESLPGRSLLGVFRPASASPATGSGASHKLEQTKLLDQAFDLGKMPPS